MSNHTKKRDEVKRPRTADPKAVPNGFECIGISGNSQLKKGHDQTTFAPGAMVDKTEDETDGGRPMTDARLISGSKRPTPRNAGQASNLSRVARDVEQRPSNNNYTKEFQNIDWIPAFAGMTEWMDIVCHSRPDATLRSKPSLRSTSRESSVVCCRLWRPNLRLCPAVHSFR